MNTKKFIEILLEDKDLQDIPITYIAKVVCAVFRILENEEVFYKEEP